MTLKLLLLQILLAPRVAPPPLPPSSLRCTAVWAPPPHLPTSGGALPHLSTSRGTSPDLFTSRDAPPHFSTSRGTALLVGAATLEQTPQLRQRLLGAPQVRHRLLGAPGGAGGGEDGGGGGDGVGGAGEYGALVAAPLPLLLVQGDLEASAEVQGSGEPGMWHGGGPGRLVGRQSNEVGGW